MFGIDGCGVQTVVVDDGCGGIGFVDGGGVPFIVVERRIESCVEGMISFHLTVFR